MTKFVAYYRVSTDKQGIDGYGMNAQKIDVQKYIADQKGNCINEFIEVESGSKCDRHAVWQAIESCKQSGATLLIAKLDRLGRNVAFISKLMDSGVNFIACDMPNASRFELHIRAALAEEERRLISDRVKKGLERAKANGVKLGGYRKPLATHNKRKQSYAQKYAESLKPKLELMVNKKLTQREMARTLNTFGITTRLGSKWTNVQVGRTLKLLDF